MEAQQFQALVARVEQMAEADPRGYVLRVFGIAALGFAILGLVIAMAMVNVALIAGVVLLVVFTGGKALLFFAKLGKLVILLAIPVWAMLRTTWTLVFARFPRPEGREIRRDEAPALFARLDEMRSRIGGPRVHRVLVTDELNAAIVQHPRLGLLGWEENTLILGLRLLQALSEDEAMAVVAHEYGHLAGNHGRFAGFIYRFRNAWGRLQAMSQQWNDWGSRLIARLFRWYAPRFNAYTFALARQNEYLADRTSVELVGARPAADALMRTGIAARYESEGFWPAIQRRIATEAEPPAGRGQMWRQSQREGLDADARQRYLDAARREATDPFDTHPALVDRLAAIGAAADGQAALRLAPPAVTAAEAWFGPRLEALSAEFDRRWRDDVAGQWKERHEHLRRQVARVAELEGKADPSDDERWEYLCAVEETDPGRDLMPLLEGLLAASPDHLSALFRRGRLRLDRGDEGGIADLERVIAADPSATLPGCDVAWQFYRKRVAEGDAERAEAWQKRWMERSAYENAVNAELSQLPADATLVPHDLPEDQLAVVRGIVAGSAKHVRQAYLVRRVLKSDPTRHDFVICIETARFTLGNKGPEVIKRLAALEWPMHVFIVHLGADPFKRFRKSIRQHRIAPFFEA
jgi:Zn-dependent protease with chaperone function